jgi:hypothetical protein
MDWTEVLALKAENGRARLSAEILASDAYPSTGEKVLAFVKQGGGRRVPFLIIAGGWRKAGRRGGLKGGWKGVVDDPALYQAAKFLKVRRKRHTNRQQALDSSSSRGSNVPIGRGRDKWSR